MRRRTFNYSKDSNTQENLNYDDKYVISGESEFSRDLTVPFDENEVLSERHFVLGDDLFDWERERRYEDEKEDYSGLGPKGYVRDDSRIFDDVCEALWQSSQVDPSEMKVMVKQGVVILKGVVRRREFKRHAERLVENIPGVVDVMNEIVVDTDEGGLIQNRTGMI